MGQVKSNSSRVLYGLLHPLKSTQYLLSKLRSPRGQRVAFWDRHFRHVPSEEVIGAVQGYWTQYRYWPDIETVIGDWTDKKVLDVGCGYTSVLNMLDGSDRYGLSIEIDDLRQRPGYWWNPEIRWVNGTAENLPYVPHSFDVVVCSNGVDHYASPELAIREMTRVLQPEGLIILTVNIFEMDKGRRDSQHTHTFTRDKLLGLLDEFDILLERISPIAAQICRLLEGRVIETPGEKELIVVARLKAKGTGKKQLERTRA
jgi:SAM-dependent methyltransferase